MHRHWRDGREGRAEQVIEEMLDVALQELGTVNGPCRFCAAISPAANHEAF
jgi:hypothetical protein